MTDTLRNREAHEAADKISTYEWGFTSDIEQTFAPKGLNEDTVRFISAKKNEPEWMLEWRLKAYRAWLTMEEVSWAKLDLPPIDYQDAYYYAEPKAKEKLGSLDEVDPEILRVYEKLGIPIEEQKVLAGVEGARRVAVDAVFDSVSVATTFRAELERAGVIFRSISEAIRRWLEANGRLASPKFIVGESYGGFRGLLMGSVSQAVLQEGEGPVMVVPTRRKS